MAAAARHRTQGLRGLKQAPPSATLANSYYYHFATRVMHHIGGAEWEFWEPRITQVLLDRQEQLDEERTAAGRRPAIRSAPPSAA